MKHKILNIQETSHEPCISNATTGCQKSASYIVVLKLVNNNEELNITTLSGMPIISRHAVCEEHKNSLVEKFGYHESL